MSGWTIDWRDEAQYAALLHADRSIFAWEWLRRDPVYALAATALPNGSTPAHRHQLPEWWGLQRFEDPARGVPCARPIWTGLADARVLKVAATPASHGTDAFHFAAFRELISCFDSLEGGEHLLISDGLKAIRLDVAEGRIGDGAAELRYLISGVRSATAPLLTLRRFLALCQTGRMSGALFRPEAKAKRWMLELRVHDALRAGACQREIASELFNADLRSVRWRVEVPTIRLQVQRLARRARMMATGGYRRLMAPLAQ